MKQGDKDTLDKVIYECIAAGMPELDADISIARDILKDENVSPPPGTRHILVFIFAMKIRSKFIDVLQFGGPFSENTHL